MTKSYHEMLDIIYDAETRQKARIYFEKYWLDEDEYFEKWRPIQNAIFDDKAKYLPDMMFNVGFELFPTVGGDIFGIESFHALQNCVHQTGDESFVIIQNRNVVIEGWPFTRFKYPVDISWAELMSGGIIGSEHFHNGCKDYFVFGDSVDWGMYVANSWIQPTRTTGMNPLNIIGFKEEFSEIFRKNFKEIRKMEAEITSEILFSEWLPENYKEHTS